MAYLFPRCDQFDYQSECHCSKTTSRDLLRVEAFDYQSECHCSKTFLAFMPILSTFDYQSECHCSKTQGNVYELKCPTGNNPKKTISRNINKGIRQIKNMPNPPDEIRLIISGLGTPLTDDQVVYQAKRTMDNTKENLVELIIILKSGDIMHLEK